MDGKTCLRSHTGESIALKSVHIEGELDGLFSTMMITQRYHNDTGKNLEIVYTFPLAWGATFLGMEVTLGEKKLQATVMERKQAWEDYEKAIDEGDAPVLVERSGSGLYTANLGNIEAGEEVTIELQYAQLLRFEKGAIHLRIPCAIAPRYGDPYLKGGLAPHETDAADLFAAYPMSLGIRLTGQIAKTEILCSTHEWSIRETEEGKEILLNSGAMLDRDICFTFSGLHNNSFALQAPDEDGCMVLASFNPAFSGMEAKPLTLKILADCSGSMNGDSIIQLRQALFSLLGLFKSGDYVSYSRFGSGVRHETGDLLPFLPNMEKSLADIFAGTEADMGGTEMEQALLSTFREVAVPAHVPSSPCILLITDGEVWNVEGILAASKACGQRIFAIGVGSAPAESLLRDLAEKTGGACELVSPNANMVTTIMNMNARMRQVQAASLRVDWGCEPLWQSALPPNLYADDTVHVFAALTEAPVRPPRLIYDVAIGRSPQEGTLSESETQLPLHVAAETITRTKNKALVRLGGAVRMAEATSREEAIALGLRYQLIGAYTALYLVHAREGVKSSKLPTLHQVPQMLAAAHGGFGSVSKRVIAHKSSLLRRSRLSCLNIDAKEERSPQHCETQTERRAYREIDTEDLQCSFYTAHELPQPTKTPIPEDILTPHQLLQDLNDKALQESNIMEIIRQIFQIAGYCELKDALDQIGRKEHLPVELVKAILLHWLAHRLSEEFSLSRHARRILRDQMKTIPNTAQTAVMKELDEMFPDITLDDWGQSVEQ